FSSFSRIPSCAPVPCPVFQTIGKSGLSAPRSERAGFQDLSDDPDFEYVLIDATLIRAHQHGTGAKGGLKNRPLANRAAVRRPKIAALVDALGNLIRFVLLPGHPPRHHQL